ncbi:MAG: hypothetical protein E4H14_07745 [Candidatus Thorarchaeota archaeon]|nr:MAG: hypothetical protein E4H14_07745 [Candidatus Thorarchaeota archaeon]
MISVVVIWISLSFILALFAVIALVFEDILIQNLTNSVVIFSSLILGTLTTLGFYYTRYTEWNESENPS